LNQNIDNRITMPKRPSPSKTNPVVLLANWYQFGPSEKMVQPKIESRCFLWCREGHGQVEVDRVSYPMQPGSFLLLPWGRRQVYTASPDQPYLLAAVHWIPDHRIDHPVVFEVAHGPDSAVAGLSWRKDAPVGDWLRGVRAGHIADASGLYHLCEFLVARFGDTPFPKLSLQSPDEMRSLASLLLAEVERVLQASLGAAVSPAFARMNRFLRDHMAQSLDLEQLAAFSQVSRATLVRLFRKETRQSPVQYVTRLRINRARELLQRTRMPIASIALAVGISDPYYFSRLFKTHTSFSPRQFRKRTPSIV
jgi:AraC-like DNA-binding protein